MKHVKNFNEINVDNLIKEGFISKNKWEKLISMKVSSPYQRTTFGIVTDSGNLDGYLEVFVDREKKKAKAIAKYGNIENEFSMNDVYNADQNLYDIVKWSYTTDINNTLEDILYTLMKRPFINDDNINNFLNKIK